MIEELERLAREATPGPWVLWTSNSWRRFRNSMGASVCEPIKQRDGHPDLHFGSAGDSAYIAALSPDRVLRLLEVVKQAKALLSRREAMAHTTPADLLVEDAALRAALAGLEEGQ